MIMILITITITITITIMIMIMIFIMIFIQDNPFSVISTGQVSKGALILKYLRKNTKSLKGKKR